MNECVNEVCARQVADVVPDLHHPPPSPETKVPSRQALFVGYLDYFRSTIIEQFGTVSPAELSTGHVKSGWTPLQLLKHLAFVERRWLEWGFLGLSIDEPWGDWRDDQWHVEEDESFAVLVGALNAQGRRTSEIVLGHDLHDVSPPGPRFKGEPPTLERILFHLLQEYARHAGHADIVVEQVTGA